VILGAVSYFTLAGLDEDGVLAGLRVLRSDLTAATIAVRNGRVVKRAVAARDGSVCGSRSAAASSLNGVGEGSCALQFRLEGCCS
jgi:hypothetical protein